MNDSWLKDWGTPGSIFTKSDLRRALALKGKMENLQYDFKARSEAYARQIIKIMTDRLAHELMRIAVKSLDPSKGRESATEARMAVRAKGRK